MNSIWLYIMLLFFFACGRNQHQVDKEEANTNTLSVEIIHFTVAENYLPKDTLKNIQLDYQNTIDSGFRIPSIRQTNDGYFHFSFKVKNTTNKSQSFFYKIYYNNESYKYPEKDLDGSYNEKATRNFYGSWKNTSITFKSIKNTAQNSTQKIQDKFIIVGNPRNEKRFFSDGHNNRWERNPRVGIYRFMLVVCTDTNKIPEYIRNISLKKDSIFISPFYYFNNKNPNYKALTARQKIKVIAKPNLGAGIYTAPKNIKKSTSRKFITCRCSDSASMYQKACFSQFISYISPSTAFYNIPDIDDFFGDCYSKKDYNWNKAFYNPHAMILTNTQTAANSPCETVFSDSVNNKIVIKNPVSTYGHLRKETIGIITRHGFTYGKYLVKAKMTQLLNKDNVWNGITNAIWLIYQGGGKGDWNLRSVCKGSGYMANYWGGVHDKRVSKTSYSEIDFEILKTTTYCPYNIFPPLYPSAEKNPFNINAWDKPLPLLMKNHDGDVVVSCTNWDLACRQPSDYHVGCYKIENKQPLHTFRWDSSYRAVSERTYANDNKLFAGKFYYFEIDWEPTSITWRIGPSPDNLYQVGHMDSSLTMIPDNQMLLIISQEFHNTKWWPGSPYQQSFIPFPAKSYVGEIYEVTIE